MPPAIFSLLTLALIFWLTLFPRPLGDKMPPLFPGADKIVHGIMFGFLTLMFLLDRERKDRWNGIKWPVIIIAILSSSLIGILIEFAQLTMALGRGFELMDMLADFIGALICGIGWKFGQRLWSQS